MAKKKWNTVHEYVVFDPASDTSKCLVKGCPSILKGKHTSNLLRHFMAYHPKIYSEIQEKNEKIKEKLMLPNHLASSANKTGKPIINSNYNIVRKACIDLVKFYEYPISLFDCQAFQDILNLIMMKPNERLRISSKYIEKALAMVTPCDDSTENEKEATSEIEIEKENGLDEVEEIEVPLNEMMPSGKRKIKAESVQCTCNAEAETSKHSPDCAVASTQEYFSHFEDETFEEAGDAPDSSVSSQEDMEEVFLDVDFIRGITKSPLEPPKKRRKSEFPVKDPINPNENRHDIEIKVSEEMGQSLDRFGLYIASLLKFLPRNKRNNFQSQIVQRLIQEQPSFAA